MKNTHFNRTPLYLLLNLQLLVCLQNLFVLDIFSKHIGIAIVGFVCTFMRGYNIHLSTFSKMGVYRVCTSFYPLLKLLKPLKPTFTKYGCCRLSNSGDVFDKKIQKLQERQRARLLGHPNFSGYFITQKGSKVWYLFVGIFIHQK